jgi:hypothetical protein
MWSNGCAKSQSMLLASYDCKRFHRVKHQGDPRGLGKAPAIADLDPKCFGCSKRLEEKAPHVWVVIRAQSNGIAEAVGVTTVGHLGAETGNNVYHTQTLFFRCPAGFCKYAVESAGVETKPPSSSSTGPNPPFHCHPRG